MLDLFCGRWGWSKAFARRGWECVGVDLQAPSEEPEDCHFIEADVSSIWYEDDSFHIPELGGFVQYIPRPDFICASPPCEQFSVHGMKHFHPNPPYPELGIKLFEHTRRICEESGVPYVIENVRAAQQFVGNAVHHCGPFYLWGTGVPPLMPKGIHKNQHFRALPGNVMEKMKKRGVNIKAGRNAYQDGQLARARREGPGEYASTWSDSEARREATALAATIPPELASCVADYAERLLESKVSS
jgi:hypothetical protein